MCEDQQFWRRLPRDFTRQSKLIWKPCHDFQSRLHRRLKSKYVNINNIIKLHGDLLPTFPIITRSPTHRIHWQMIHNPIKSLRASVYEVPPLLPKSQIHTFQSSWNKLSQKSHINHIKSQQQGWLLARIFEGSRLCVEDGEAELDWTIANWSKVFLARPDRLKKVQLTFQLPSSYPFID